MRWTHAFTVRFTNIIRQWITPLNFAFLRYKRRIIHILEIPTIIVTVIVRIVVVITTIVVIIIP